MKKISALLFALVLLFSLFPPSARSAGSGTISEDGTYDISDYGNDSIITINGGLTVTLTNTTDATFTNMQINCIGANTNLTINNVKIDDTSNSNTCALAFTGESNTLTLTGASDLTSGYNEPGIRVESGTELVISGSGALEVTGGSSGAGIGSGGYRDSGIITISGGTVTAHGGLFEGAGIGGGSHGDSGIIIISGGTVNASGGYNAAGIGGGYGGDCNEIEISVGVINASATNEWSLNGAAAIGGGGNGSGGKITITGGTITTTMSGITTGAGIGCGVSGDGVEILITGGNINVNNKLEGAGIGGSSFSDNVSVTISGGTVIAASGATGIGSGDYSSNCTVTINGDAQVTASGLAGIGVGLNSPGCTVTIGGSAQVTAAGIGVGSNSSGCTVTIDGSAHVTATSTSGGAGIGGTASGNGVDVIIEGGVVFAAGASGMDIGHGSSGTSEGTLSISGNSAVFFANDSFPAPTTSHTYFSMTSADTNGEIYEAELPAGWTQASGYYSDTVQLLVTHNANDAIGPVPDSFFNLLAQSLTFTAVYADDLSYPGAKFIKWNTADDGTGMDIIPELTYTTYSDLTLYAIWKKSMVTLTLDKSSLLLTQNEVSKLTAAYTPADADSTIFWISSDNSVATVDQSGNVTAMGEGTATITASTDSRSAECNVTVSKKSVTAVNLNYGSKSLYVGDWLTLTATVSPSGATNPSVTWKSSNTSVATVTGGMVKAVGDGFAKITATADGVTATCDVSVGTKAVTSVSLDYSSQKMYEGGIFVLTAAVTPDDAADPSVTWESSASSVASVNRSGVVTAHGEGTCTITATAGDESDTCEVTVLPEPEIGVASLDIFNRSGFTAILYVGDTMSLSAHVSPADATYSSVTWSSSEASVASVSSLGQVTAKSEGSATITAAAGDKTATYSITVKTHEEPGASPTQTSAPAEAPTPVIETVVKEVVVTVKLDTTTLPEGTKYIKLPNGEIIELTGEETMSITVPEDSVNGDGTIEIIALDDDQVPLGSVEAEAEDMPQKTSLMNVFLGILAGLATGIAGTIVALRIIITRKKG